MKPTKEETGITQLPNRDRLYRGALWTFSKALDGTGETEDARKLDASAGWTSKWGTIRAGFTIDAMLEVRVVRWYPDVTDMPFTEHETWSQVADLLLDTPPHCLHRHCTSLWLVSGHRNCTQNRAPGDKAPASWVLDQHVAAAVHEISTHHYKLNYERINAVEAEHKKALEAMRLSIQQAAAKAACERVHLDAKELTKAMLGSSLPKLTITPKDELLRGKVTVTWTEPNGQTHVCTAPSDLHRQLVDRLFRHKNTWAGFCSDLFSKNLLGSSPVPLIGVDLAHPESTRTGTDPDPDAPVSRDFVRNLLRDMPEDAHRHLWFAHARLTTHAIPAVYVEIILEELHHLFVHHDVNDGPLPSYRLSRRKSLKCLVEPKHPTFLLSKPGLKILSATGHCPIHLIVQELRGGSFKIITRGLVHSEDGTPPQSIITHDKLEPLLLMLWIILGDDLRVSWPGIESERDCWNAWLHLSDRVRSKRAAPLGPIGALLRRIEALPWVAKGWEPRQ